MKHIRWRFLWVCAFIAACLGVAGVWLLCWSSLAKRAGTEYEFRVAPLVQYLTDELAVTKAAETLLLDGYDMSHWEMVPDGRTKAPNGSPDEYLFRCNDMDPNRGLILFRQREPWAQGRVIERLVSIELRGDRIKTQVHRPK